MSHSITTRDVASSERKRLRQTGWWEGPFTAIMIIGLMVVAGLGASAFLLWVLEKIGIKIAESIRWYGFGVVVLAAAVVGVFSGGSYFRFVSRSRQREKLATKQPRIEMIAVENPIVIQQEEHNDEGPIYYLEIGEGKILMVCGQWMYDSHIYEPPPPDSDGEDDENFPPFPCHSFVLHRVAISGHVLRIEVKGPKTAPTRTIKRKEVFWEDYFDSLVFDGDLDHLQEAMSRATGKSKRKH